MTNKNTSQKQWRLIKCSPTRNNLVGNFRAENPAPLATSFCPRLKLEVTDKVASTKANANRNVDDDDEAVMVEIWISKKILELTDWLLDWTSNEWLSCVDRRQFKRSHRRVRHWVKFCPVIDILMSKDGSVLTT